MKKLTAGILLAALGLAAIAVSTPAFSGGMGNVASDRSGRIRIYTDPVTRCQYLAFSDYKAGGGITPRMRRDGTQVCPR